MSLKCFESILIHYISREVKPTFIKWLPSTLNKRCLTLDEKIKILDEAKKRKLSYRTIAEKFNAGKTQAANVMKNESKRRKEFETFQGKGFKHLKTENHQKFEAINEILYTWSKKAKHLVFT